MRFNVFYLLFTLSSSILFADFACAYTVLGVRLYGPLDLPGFRLIAASFRSYYAVDTQDDDGCDFWCRANQKLESVRREADQRLTNAKEVAAEMGNQVGAFKQNAEEVVNSVAGLRDLIGAENQGHAAGAKFKRATIDLDAVAADLEVAFGVVINELQEMFPEPKDAAGHENRSKAVEVALEKAGVVLIKVCGDHGLDEERVAAHWGAIRAYLFTAIVFLGDIVEQHPVLFESLFFVLIIAILPEVWLSRPLFRIFGFGPQGPIKGSAAAWAQRVFFGGRVQKNSWFAILESAGMVRGSWFGSAWRWVLCTVFKVC